MKTKVLLFRALSCALAFFFSDAISHAQTPPDPASPAAPSQSAPAAQQPQSPSSILTEASAGDRRRGFNPNTPVPLRSEPHHQLVLENEFVRVFTVMMSPMDATLPHIHSLPYLYLSIGPADFTNAVVGKPEVRVTLLDGETRYSPGHFTHVIRTDSGLPLQDVTVEFLHPQSDARNLCQPVDPGLPTSCPQQASAAAGRKPSEQTGDADVPYFETAEMKVDLIGVNGLREYIDPAPQYPALMIARNNANLDVSLGGQHFSFLHGGDVLWLPANVHRRFVDFLGTNSTFLLISFKDAGATPSGQ